MGTVIPSSARRPARARRAIGPSRALHFAATLPKTLHVPRFENGGGAVARAFAMSTDSISAALEPSVFGDTRAVEAGEARSGRGEPAPRRPSWSSGSPWRSPSSIVGAIVGYALLKTYRATDAIERDRLHAQARVIGENVGQQLDGINRALASVRDDFIAMPPHQTSTLLSARLKVLSDAIPGVRSMVVLDADGTVVASSVDALLGRDFADRDYFRVPKSRAKPGHAPRRLAVQDRARQLHDRLRPGDRRRRTAPSPAPPSPPSSPSTSRC